MKLCVIGDPIKHSLSPKLHRELLQKSGIDGTYSAETVTAAELTAFVAAAKAGAWDGFNVTMPHKTAILPLLEELDDTAAAMGAVNTVVIREGRAKGYNTDGPGFVASLPFAPAGKRTVIMGNGGAAHAVAYALTKAGARVSICCRHPEGTEQPCEKLYQLCAKCDLLVNATPLGMTGQGQFTDFAFLERLPANAVVYDLVYEPRQTGLLNKAAAAGHPIMGGLALLRAQAELAFHLFTAP